MGKNVSCPIGGSDYWPIAIYDTTRTSLHELAVWTSLDDDGSNILRLTEAKPAAVLPNLTKRAYRPMVLEQNCPTGRLKQKLGCVGCKGGLSLVSLYQPTQQHCTQTVH